METAPIEQDFRYIQWCQPLTQTAAGLDKVDISGMGKTSKLLTRSVTESETDKTVTDRIERPEERQMGRASPR